MCGGLRLYVILFNQIHSNAACSNNLVKSLKNDAFVIVHMFVHTFVCRFVVLLVYRFVVLLVCRCVILFVYIFVNLFLYMFVILFVILFICSSCKICF